MIPPETMKQNQQISVQIPYVPFPTKIYANHNIIMHQIGGKCRKGIHVMDNSLSLVPDNALTLTGVKRFLNIPKPCCFWNLEEVYSF